MGVSAAVFESAGKRTEHYVPGTYSRQSNTTTPGGIPAGNLCILGEAQGGKPKALLEFGTLQDAKLTLSGGSLLEGVGYAFNGSREYIPQKVYAVRVNNGTQAELTMNAGATPLLKIKAWDWGAHTNQLKMWVKNGTTAGSKTITTVYKDETLKTDDIIRPSLNIEYIGDGTVPTVSIGATAITLSHIPDGETDPETNTFTFVDYSTLATLAARINDTGLFAATVADTDTQALSANLDTITGVDVTDSVLFYSNFKAFLEALKANVYVGSVEILDATTRTMPDSTDGYVYFTGGTSSVASVSDYMAALEMLESQNIQIIATPSTDASVQALIANHCVQMCSTVNRKERTCILGGAIGESDNDAILKAVGFNSEVVSYVTDSAIANNPLTGQAETIPGAMVAVMLAGMESGMAANMPLTNKTLNVVGFTKHRNITNMENLIKKGVLVCNYDPEDISRYVCIRSLTTYQEDDLIYNEMSMVREAFLMNRELRNAYKPLIGKPRTFSVSDVVQILTNIASKWAQKGYIVPDDSNQNVWDIRVVIDGDKIYVTYSRYLTAPTNFVFITANNHVYTTTLEV